MIVGFGAAGFDGLGGGGEVVGISLIVALDDGDDGADHRVRKDLGNHLKKLAGGVA